MTDEQKAILDWVLRDSEETADAWFTRNVADVGEDEAVARVTAKANRWRGAYLAAMAAEAGADQAEG